MLGWSSSPFGRILRLTTIAISVGVYTVVAPFGYALFALLWLLPGRDQGQRTRFTQRVVRGAFSALHRWMRLTRILDFAPGHFSSCLPEGPFVVVANHPTLTDTTALLGTVPQLCTVVRHDLYERYWLRPLLRGAGHFDAGVSSSNLSVTTLIGTAVTRLRLGFRVLVFPEGSRSPEHGLGRFARAPFEIACRARVPVVAVKIDENPTWLAKGDRLLGPVSDIPVKKLGVLEIVVPDDFSGDSRAMRDYVERLYQSALVPPSEVAQMIA